MVVDGGGLWWMRQLLAVAVVIGDGRVVYRGRLWSLKYGNDFPCSTLAGDVKRGEAVFTVGSPLGYYHSVVPGHIRFVDRRIHHVHFPLASDILLLEHSMPIHHGNSGGPIYNYRGSMAEEEVRGELEIDKGTVVPIYVPILLYSLGFGIPSSSKVVQKVDAIFEAEESLPQDGNGGAVFNHQGTIGNQAFKQGATTSVDPEASKDNVPLFPPETDGTKTADPLFPPETNETKTADPLFPPEIDGTKTADVRGAVTLI
ncbi:hypothetical protein RJ640_002605 [Escallonia rubra]|uniref:Uncharacterized protein n=1 Tax=Escallonia rubra TaxID=112253 RepID=A0AA88UUB7_9ASTE|nr:hypothetical protein RJ640_002605 [Escallonia rubra]